MSIHLMKWYLSAWRSNQSLQHISELSPGAMRPATPSHRCSQIHRRSMDNFLGKGDFQGVAIQRASPKGLWPRPQSKSE